jgi:hypothetical protein
MGTAKPDRSGVLSIRQNARVGDPAVELGHGHGVDFGQGLVQPIRQRITREGERIGF